MAILLDTNILARMTDTLDKLQVKAVQAVTKLHRLGETLHITPQNLVEFRNVSTRPRAVNGLGLTIAASEQQAQHFEVTFPLLQETPAVFPAWKAIVSGLGVVGKQVHDARLVAVCHVHAVSHILTFNDAHFARFAGFGPGIVVLHPKNV